MNRPENNSSRNPHAKKCFHGTLLRIDTLSVNKHKIPIATSRVWMTANIFYYFVRDMLGIYQNYNYTKNNPTSTWKQGHMENDEQRDRDHGFYHLVVTSKKWRSFPK